MMDDENNEVDSEEIFKDRPKTVITKYKKAITTEKNKLTNIFKKCDKNVKKIVSPLIENAAYMKVELANLKEHNIKYGIKEFYMNGKGQFGYKESVESKTYNNMIKNYMNAIKQLNEYLPKDEKINPDDDFDNFGENT